MNYQVIRKGAAAAAALAVGVVLYLLSLYSYLLFHSVAEIFSVVIAGSIFIIGWNSRKYIQNNYLLFICAPYLFIAVLDTLHTLSYTGMHIFLDYDYYANQIWIAARYMESITLLLAFFALRKKERINAGKILWVYLGVTSVMILSIFVWKIFPICFVKGSGLTPFKVYSEYVICLILTSSLFLLYKARNKFSEQVYKYLFISIMATIATELAFTFYISNYGISNLVGHYLKIISFYYVYKSIVQTGLETPQYLIFKELNDTREDLALASGTKDKLISVLAHDLRGPIGSLYSLFEDIHNTEDYKDPETCRMVVEMSLTSMGAVNEMLENTLNWARLQRNVIRPKVVVSPVADVVEEAVSPLRLMASKKEIRIAVNISENEKARLDSEMAKTVIRNIVNNAIKFCHNRCSVTITAEKEPGSTVITIADDGPGIDAGIADRIFSIDRSDIAHIPNAGTGLGLGICRDFMTLLGGTISVRSTVGKGTHISLRFMDTESA